MLALRGAFSLFVLGLSVSGCFTELAAGTTVKVVGRAAPAIQRYEDPELAEEAMPASISTLEGLLEIRKDDTNLRALLARTYSSFGFGFMEDRMEEALEKDDEANAERYRKRAGMAYRRARELALGSLTLWEDEGGGADGHIKKGLEAWTEYLKKFDDAEEHVPTLFWAAYSWGRYIGLNRDDMNALADLPLVTALADRVYALDHTFMGHAPHALRAGLIGTAPAQLGGRPLDAKKEFELAIAGSGGKNLMYYVVEAQIVAVALQDRALYQSLLTKVVEAPTDLNPDERLLNQIAKRRAERYLRQIDQLFEPEAPPEPAPEPSPATPAPAAPAKPGTAPAPAAPAAPAPSAAAPAAKSPAASPKAPAPAAVPAPKPAASAAAPKPQASAAPAAKPGAATPAPAPAPKPAASAAPAAPAAPKAAPAPAPKPTASAAPAETTETLNVSDGSSVNPRSNEGTAMKTRNRILIPFALALGLLTRAPVTVAEDKPPAAVKTLSIATLAPPGSTWMKVFEAWNREIRRRSNGTMQLRFYPGGVQGDESEVIRKIRNGRIDGAAVTAVGLAQIHRPALVFQMPGILRTYAQLDAARDAITPEMNPKFAQAGFQLLGWADVGMSRVMSTHPVTKPADLAPRKPWVWRDDLVLPEFFKVVKSNPVPLQLPEVLGALQTNRVDTVITTPVAALALQWSSRVSHLLDFPLTIVIGGTVLGQKQWESLTPEQKTIMTETAAQFHALARKNLRNDETKALATIKERNIKVLTPSESDKAAWLEAGKQVRERLVGQIADRALVDRVMTFAK